MSIHSGMREVAGSRNMKGVSSNFEDAFGELVVDVECSLKGESAMIETKANVTANRTARSVTNELGGRLRVRWRLEDKRSAFFRNRFFTFVKYQIHINI